MGFGKSGAQLAKVICVALSAERERWILWIPIAVGAGIASYFALPFEPARWVAPLILLSSIGAGWLARNHPAGWAPALAVALAALGFTLATERTADVAAPVLERPTGVIRLQGHIAEVEPLESGQRLVLDRLSLPPLPGHGLPPQRVRLHLPADVAARPGQRVDMRAMLLPPPPPVAPGAYDFSRQAWFKGLGAVGFAVGTPRVFDDPAEAGMGEGLRLWLANLRRDLTRRIVGSIDGAGIGSGVGAVAAALITAERGPVSPDLLQAYRDAGLAHILVIAGMHMSMVAGLVFVAIRGILAAIPPIALRHNVKKWTAVGALLITLGYLIISGAPVPTQRAFMMNGIVLLAVLLDRQAISLRSITLAALVILLLQPEALIGASFQMSFAAVYGLISGYEVLGPRLAEWHHGSRQWWKVPLFYAAGILLTTQIAGSATAFYTAFHFNRYATYSLLGNFLAVPIVGFWVMPAALLAFCLLPFGLDGWGWQLMGAGIVVINKIAKWVSSLPGGTFDLPRVPVSALIVFTLGGFWLCLWKTRWRLWGLAGIAAGLVIYALDRPPDILVEASGKLMAVRDAEGRLTLSPGRAGRSVRETWSKLAGEGTDAPTWRDGLGDSLRCDSDGCLYRARDHVVSLARRPEALAEDCRVADVVVVPVPVRTDCPSARLLIDGFDLRRRGTHALWLDEGTVRLQTVQDWQGRRPWAHLAETEGDVDSGAPGGMP